MALPQTNNLPSDLCIKMSDGRVLTNYKQNSQITCEIMSHGNITDSYDLKAYLINNGQSIRQNNNQFYLQKTSCGSCQFPSNSNMVVPDPNGNDAYWANYKQSLPHRNQ